VRPAPRPARRRGVLSFQEGITFLGHLFVRPLVMKAEEEPEPTQDEILGEPGGDRGGVHATGAGR
jgi:hypothetical protein